MGETTENPGRELLRVYVTVDGKLDVDVLATFPNDVDNTLPARLSLEVAKAIWSVLGGGPAVSRELERLNRSGGTVPVINLPRRPR